MAEKNYSLDKQTKRQIGAALWQIRYEKHLYLKNVTTATNIPSRIIEGMELDKFIHTVPCKNSASIMIKK